MRSISNHFIIAAVFAGLCGIAPTVAHADCAISVGNGEGKTMETAQRRAKRDARQKAGNVRPDNASYSEPACFVADDFKNGIASYGCEVEYSYCTAPKLPNSPKKAARKNGRNHGPELAKTGKPGHWGKWHKRHGRHHGGWSGTGQAGHFIRSHGRGNGQIAFGAWGRTRTEVSCLRFNARATAASASQASELVNAALIKSMDANIGSGFQHGKVEMAGPSCEQTGARNVTCGQTARYCF